MNPELRANTIRWLAGISGELQRKITKLETEIANSQGHSQGRKSLNPV